MVYCNDLLTTWFPYQMKNETDLCPYYRYHEFISPIYNKNNKFQPTFHLLLLLSEF